jgi:hypothetical protein
MAFPMTVYAPGQVAIGRILDGGPRSVLAHVVNDAGGLVPLGFFEDRRTAREAVEKAWCIRAGPITR